MSRTSMAGISRLVITLLGLAVATASAQHYDQKNLVSDIPGATVQDPNLQNPWGLTRASTSPWWVSDNGTGKATLYNEAGTPLSLVVTIPGLTADSTGTPTGAVFNGTTDFKLTNGNPARFIFVTEDGTIAGWNGGTTAQIVVNQSPHSVFKGATIGEIDGANFLYVADFRKGRIEVFNGAFQRVRLGEDAFDNDEIPRGFAPFNVQNIGGNLYVTYALQDSAKHDEVHGPGLGYVDVYSPRGRLRQRLQHGPWLNAPWGMALAPSDFGKFSHMVLVGQFGSGQIAAYNAATGRFNGLMLKSGTVSDVLTIDGLWALSFGGGTMNNGPLNTLFFTAGIDDEAHGLFGTLTPVSAELTQGNEQ